MIVIFNQASPKMVVETDEGNTEKDAVELLKKLSGQFSSHQLPHTGHHQFWDTQYLIQITQVPMYKYSIWHKLHKFFITRD